MKNCTSHKYYNKILPIFKLCLTHQNSCCDEHEFFLNVDLCTKIEYILGSILVVSNKRAFNLILRGRRWTYTPFYDLLSCCSEAVLFTWKYFCVQGLVMSRDFPICHEIWANFQQNVKFRKDFTPSFVTFSGCWKKFLKWLDGVYVPICFTISRWRLKCNTI